MKKYLEFIIIIIIIIIIISSSQLYLEAHGVMMMTELKILQLSQLPIIIITIYIHNNYLRDRKHKS
jgi:hypothetical protein